MKERTITDSKGESRTLLGPELAIGDRAPEFSVLAGDLSPRTLAHYAGKKKLISVVPSLDTGVCDLQTKRFNTEAAALGPDVAILTISVDLPFAQSRWCASAGVEAVEVLSDHRDTDFGLTYGVLIKELRLLNRAIFVLDRENVIRYKEILPDLGNHPDYDAALAAVRNL
ncbi:MAG: thiol peroxidase [Spirochaetales bacterium]|nr:thiol peroxidase [Spirochaetales bacterium]